MKKCRQGKQNNTASRYGGALQQFASNLQVYH